ncbi:MAG: hypothetical protein PWQ82_272 [Thermosediminibacterales bacterium]|nr:hypothetical protein [Thermosediminibacterales bacterium]MDK2835295.1 hypothetical protein [Thermosediminibacterales bacterium]
MKCINKIRVINLLTIVVLYFMSVFSGLRCFEIATGLIVMIALAMSFPFINRANKLVSFILFIFATLILVFSKADFLDYVDGFRKNSGLLVLFLLVPLLGIPFKFDKYQNALKHFYENNIKNGFHFYFFSYFTSFLLGGVINVAAIPIVYEVSSSGSEIYSGDCLSKAIVRGNSLGVLWSPSYLSIAVVLSFIEIPWVKLLPYGFGLALLGVFIGSLVEYVFIKNISNDVKVYKTQNANRDLWELFGVGLFLLLSIIFLNQTTSYGVLTIVPLVSIVFPVLWALVFKRFEFYNVKVSEFLKTGLLNADNQLVLFGLAGYLGYAMQRSGISEKISNFFDTTELTGSILFSFVLIILISLASVFGLHPLITVSAMASAFSGTSNPLFMALILLISYSIAVNISPFSATVLITAGLLKESPFLTGIRNNWLYCFLYGITSCIVVNLIL